MSENRETPVKTSANNGAESVGGGCELVEGGSRKKERKVKKERKKERKKWRRRRRVAPAAGHDDIQRARVNGH